MLEEKHIIRNNKINKHNVESYRFKVLGTQITPQKEEDGIEEYMKDVQQPTVINEDHQPPQTQQTQSATNIPDDSFVEKLLKKTDELSSENIKLQMQNENQKAEFERELTTQIQTAKEEAQKQGYQKAKDEMDATLKTLQEQYCRSCKLLDEQLQKLEEFIKKTEFELPDTAMEIAKEVIQKEITQDSSQIALALSKSLIKMLQNSTQMEIRANPNDFPILNEKLGQTNNLKITSDEAIAQGGIIILSDAGNLDGSIKTRIDKIMQLTRE